MDGGQKSCACAPPGQPRGLLLKNCMIMEPQLSLQNIVCLLQPVSIALPDADEEDPPSENELFIHRNMGELMRVPSPPTK